MKKRIEYLDYLRFIATVLVILLHVLSYPIYNYLNNNTPRFLFYVFLNSFTRVAVPIFFMLTGILMFQKKEEKNYLEYFKKRVLRFINAYVLISILYYLYFGLRGDHSLQLYDFIRMFTSSTTSYHLWYLQVTIILYLFIPFLKRFVETLSKKELKTLIILIGILSYLFSSIGVYSNLTGYPILYSFKLPNILGYMNYLFIGYYLVKENCKVNKKLIIISILSIIGMCISTYLVRNTSELDFFLGSISIYVLAPSILIFLLFKNHQIHFPKKITTFIQKNSNTYFGIYLIHVLLLECLKQVIPYTNKNIGIELLIIVGATLLILIGSFIVTKLTIIIRDFLRKEKEVITSIFLQLLSYFFIFFFLFVLINIFRNPYHFIKINPLLTILGIICGILFFLIITKYQETIWKYKWLNRFMLIGYVFFQIIFVRCFIVTPSWDFGEIYDLAVSFATSSNPTFGSAYLYMCSNNIMFSAILDIIFKLAYLIGLKSHFLELGITLNIIMIDISFLYFYLLLKEINPKYTKPFFLFSLFFSPLVCYLPIFYTDTLSIPFITISLYYIYKFLFVNQKYRYIMITGLLLGIGSYIKPTTLILVVALIIYLVLKEKDIIKMSITILLLITVIALPILGQKLFINHFFSEESLMLYRIPKLHYIVIGLEGNGEYSEERFQRVNSILGVEKKEKLLKKDLKEKINEMSKNHEFLFFYQRKITYTWSDGSFFSYVKLSRKPIHKEYTKYISSTDKKDTLYWIISNSEWIIILILMILGNIFKKYLPSKLKDLQFLLNISIFGIFLFLLIWETRSRYLVNFSFLFLMNAFIGICAINEFLKEKKVRSK